MGLEDAHSLTVEDVLRKLGTGPRGLTEDEARRRLEKYGPNELVAERRISALEIWVKQFKSPLILILLAATVISYVISVMEGEFPVDSILIFAIVMAASTLGFVQEYRAERAIEALREMLTPTVTVLRDGVEKVISAREVVPGDVILVSAGDRVVADCRIFESINLQANEAPLTGESTPVLKQAEPVSRDASLPERRCMLYAGTTITYGKGKAVVVATGMKTELGKIAREVTTIEITETPLERRMSELGSILGKLVIGVCLAIAVALIVEDLLIVGRISLETIIEVMLFATALAVAVIPEALPAIVTGTLAIGMREMAKRNALVRRMPAVETLGCVTVICSDKTGTLTKGEMTVKKIYVDGRVIEVTGVGYEPKGELRGEYDPSSEAFKLLMLGAALCNDAKLAEAEDGWKVEGDPTEGALVVAAEKAGFKHGELRSRYPRVDEIPFSSERKRMTTIHELEDGRRVALMKGAVEIVLERCNYVQVGDQVRELTHQEREKILKVNERFASDALRNLAFAYKRLEGEASRDEIERDMVFLGLMGMIDPPRGEAIEAAKTCKRIGIKPIMITGDHKLTAVAVAKQMGIYEGGDDLVLTGGELEKISDEEFEKIVDKVTVYARVSPMHKLKIVRAWKKRGEVVAMTGDGVNDAPAVKQADIGVAMGRTGTEVTKEASDMILLDDNFATIIKAIELGRWIYDNIKKYLLYLLSCNMIEIVVLSIGALISIYLFREFALPLLPAHILYINLATDGLPALALGVSPSEPDVMERPPRDPRESIFSREVLPFMIVIPAVISPLLLLIYFTEYDVTGATRAVTLVFLTFVFIELVIALNCRSLRFSIFKAPPHKFLVLAVLWEAFLISFLINIPSIREAFRITLPTLSDLLLIAASCLLAFILCEVIKAYLVKRGGLSWEKLRPRIYQELSFLPRSPR